LIAIDRFDLLATPEIAGYYHTWIGVFRVILQFLLVDWLIRKFNERRILVTGIICMIIAMIGFAFSYVYWVAFIPLTFLAFGTGTARPILSSRLTNSVNKKEYATILGINNSLTSFNQIFVPMLGGALLLVDLPEILLALCAVSFSIILILLLIEKQKEKKSISSAEIQN
jgi:DHA1 family multidrug resistance protein-like MFS transporter